MSDTDNLIALVEERLSYRAASASGYDRPGDADVSTPVADLLAIIKSLNARLDAIEKASKG